MACLVKSAETRTASSKLSPLASAPTKAPAYTSPAPVELSLHFFGGIAAQRARFVRIIDRARCAFLAARDRSVRAESVQFFKHALKFGVGAVGRIGQKTSLRKVWNNDVRHAAQSLHFVDEVFVKMRVKFSVVAEYGIDDHCAPLFKKAALDLI